MSDRELDQQLVERVQRGDKQAFGLLVSKYQRKLNRLLSRLIRDPAEVEDVAQETFIKAYRALGSFRGDSAFYTWLYRIGINTAKNYLVSLGRRAPTSTSFDSEEAETFEDGDQLRDINTPERLLMTRQIGVDRGGRDGRTARGAEDGDHVARARGAQLRGDRRHHGLPDRHGALADLPRARSDSRTSAAPARYGPGQTLVGASMKDKVSALLDGDLDDQGMCSVIDAMRRDGSLRAQWGAYCLIGDTLRGDRAGFLRFRCARHGGPGRRAHAARTPHVLRPRRRSAVLRSGCCRWRHR